MTIPEYLKELLIFNEKVVLPGLGSIKIVKKAGTIKAGKLSPPASVIEFDPSEGMDDEVLSSKISLAEEINQEEARQRVLEFTDEIRFALDRGEKFEMAGFCHLQRNEDNEIEVIKHPDFTIDFEGYGLESFELDELDDSDEIAEDSETQEKETSEETIDETDSQISEQETKNEYQESPEIENEPEPLNESANSKQNRSTVWIITGAVIVLLAAIIIIPLKTNLFNNTIDFGKFFNDEEFQMDDEFTDSESKNQGFDEMVDELEGSLDSATAVENALGITKETKPSPEDAGTEYIEYHIIAGSFRDLANAEELQKKLTLMGYPSLIIEPGNGVYRVSVMSFRDKSKALQLLIEFRDKTGMSEAWLMNLQ